MVDSLVPGWHLAIIGGNIHDGPGHCARDNRDPWAVVARGPVIVPVMGTIPVAVIKEDVHADVGYKVDIGRGDQDYGGRCRNHHRG
ncbi:MAG: hypothetical protein H6Q48_3717 [Deltaproteobacteria bacterium]|nr:hypothetical protein [Deltaproteobacteria bacterium]